MVLKGEETKKEKT